MYGGVTLLRRLPRHERPHRLDFLGAFLIMTASVAFMLALSMGGVRYPWTSPAILALFAIAVVVGTGFVARLLTASEPLIPLAILSNKEARLTIIANTFGWGPIVGLHIFLPMYLQNIVGLSPALASRSAYMAYDIANAQAYNEGAVFARDRATGTFVPDPENPAERLTLPGDAAALTEKYDVIVNSFSLQEMELATVQGYFAWIAGLNAAARRRRNRP